MWCEPTKNVVTIVMGGTINAMGDTIRKTAK